MKARDDTEDGVHCTTVSWHASSSLHTLQKQPIFDSSSSKLCFLTRSLKTASGTGTDITCSCLHLQLTVFSAPSAMTPASSSSQQQPCPASTQDTQCFEEPNRVSIRVVPRPQGGEEV